jgi:GH18 family chitinase
MEEILTANPDTYISVAVPGKAEDKNLSYDKAAITKLDPLVSMWNVMTYDLVSREFSVLEH